MRLQKKDDYLKRAAAIPDYTEKVLLINWICLLAKIFTGFLVTGHHGPTEVGPVLIHDHTAFNPANDA